MATPTHPVGAARANGTRSTSASIHGQIIELVMEAQAMLLTAQRLLATAQYAPAWDGSERRLG